MRIGDTAGKIAMLFTGSPVNAGDLVRANPQKGSTFKNGQLAFKPAVMPGERLTLPDSWLRSRPGLPLGVSAPPPGYEYPGAFGPKYGGSGGQFQNIWESQDHSLYPVTGGASVYGQYYVTSQGSLTLGALIIAAHPDQQIPAGFQSAALQNANPLLRGVDPNISLPAGTRVNVPERWVDLLKAAGYSVGNNMGVGQLPAPTLPAPPLPTLTQSATPPGGSTPILCPDGSIAPDSDPMRCPPLPSKPDSSAPEASVASSLCPDGSPAPDGDVTHCPPAGAPTAAWVQNKHGKWVYQNPDFPGWVYPLEKNQWIFKGGHASVTSDGKLTIAAVLTAAGQAAASNAAFFGANPNLRNVDPKAALPAGTIVNVPKAWEQSLTASGVKVTTSVGVGYHGFIGQAAPAPPPAPGAKPVAHPAAPPAPAAAHPAAPAAARPAPPAHPAAPAAHPAPPAVHVHPEITTGWVTGPAGHRWYRDPSRPGYGFDQQTNSWRTEADLAAAYAAGAAVATTQQYTPYGGAAQADTAAQQAYGDVQSYQQELYPQGQYNQTYPQYGGYAAPQYTPVATGWARGPAGSWQYSDPRYPGYGYDWGQRRWMHRSEIFSVYGR